MPRPCFLVLDPEHPGSISTRKLVIETAKLNVISAYSSSELLEGVERFPNVDGAVLDSRVNDMDPAALVAVLRQKRPGLPVVLVTAPGTPHGIPADFFVDSLDPRSLLDTLRSLCPSEASSIITHERDLEADEQKHRKPS